MVCGCILTKFFELSDRPTVFDIHCICYKEELSSIITVEKDDLIFGELHQECSLSNAWKCRTESGLVKLFEEVYELIFIDLFLRNFFSRERVKLWFWADKSFEKIVE